MKKKLTTIIAAAVLALAMTASLALMGCDDPNAVRYDFEKITTEVDGEIQNEDYLVSMFKDSYIYVSDSKLTWVMKDMENEMGIEKDGDKDVLSGEYTKNLVASYEEMGATIKKCEVYGINTGDGYNLVMDVVMGYGNHTSQTISTIVFKQAK